MFPRSEKEITVSGVKLTITELSASVFASISKETDDNEHAFNMIHKSITNQVVSVDEIREFPHKVVTELIEHILVLNGLGANDQKD
tara:strand:- start:214 stop:471 length:258 start_codon:yes stop_codon:yes gene_type:complete